MCKKKYSSYSIQIVYLNSDVETINYKEEGVDTSNYGAMLEVYRQTKKSLASTSATVRFIGKSSINQELEIMFYKEIVTADKAIHTEGVRISELTAEEALKNLAKALEDIEKIKNRTGANDVVFNKTQDGILHEIERNAIKEVPIAQKVEAYNALEDLRINRRRDKDSHRLIMQFQSNILERGIKCDVLGKGIADTLNGYNKYIKNNKPENLTKEENNAIKEKMMKCITYRSLSEKNTLLKKYKKIYAKVTDDPSKLTLTCINFCK